MKWKRIFTGVLAITLVVTSITACSKNNSTTKKQEAVAMGRYVEKSIEMPEAVAAYDEIAYQMVKNPEGNIELYALPLKPKKGEYTIQYTLGEDNQWKRSLPKWLNKKSDGGSATIAYAADGTKYAVIDKNKKSTVVMKFYKSKDNVNADKVVLNDYKKDVDYSKRPMNMKLLQDNSILLGYQNSCTIYQDGKAKTNFKIGDYKYALSDNKLLTMNEKMDGGLLIDITTGKTISEVPMDKNTNPIFTADQKGNWYMVTSSGIHRMVKDGNSWETVLDGDLATMSMPSMGPETVIKGDKDDFYVMYQSGNGVRTIKHYVYDKNIPTTPSKTLSIVSLKENSTVRQAIVDFQHKNQDIKVEYRALISEEDGTTATDNIKKINTELLAGKGADILILDGMPVNSYIEKGVLADISNIIEPGVKSGKLLSNIMDNYKKDGKIYTAPLRYSLAFAFGDKNAVKATESLQALADYAKTAKIPLLGEKLVSYTDVTSILFQMYSNSFMDEQGIHREGLVKFLEQLKVISDQTKATKEESQYPMYGQEEMSLNTTSAQLLVNKSNRALLGLSDISDMYGIYAPFAVVEKIKGDYAAVNNQFIPKGLVGINNASKQKKLAGSFIQSLFEEPVQKAELGDGFPVNTKALENFGLKYDDFLIGMDGFEVTQPSKEKMQELLNLCKVVNKPINVDQTLLDMVISETSSYLSGNSDVNATADKIMEKTKTYLNE
jgi:hypothetical protein